MRRFVHRLLPGSLKLAPPRARSGIRESSRIAEGREAFTLIELLVVIAIVAVLISLLLPTLVAVRKQADTAKCLANIRSQLQAIHLYANEYRGAIVCGSSNPLEYPGQGAWLPVNSLATFQFWLGLNHEAPGLGRLLEKGLLNGESLFCPTDMNANPTAELDKFRARAASDAWCSYLVRQLDGQAGRSPRTRLNSLGKNAKGVRIVAIVMDIHCSMRWNLLPTKIPHDGLKCGIGFIDGSAKMVPNTDGNLTFKGSTGQVEQRLNQILEYADSLGQ